MANGKTTVATILRLSWLVEILSLLAVVGCAAATVNPTPAPVVEAAATPPSVATSPPPFAGGSRPTPGTTIAPASSATSSAALGGGRGGTSVSVVLGILSGVIACTGAGTMVLYCLYKKNRDKKNRVRNDLFNAGLEWGDKGAGRGSHNHTFGERDPSSTPSIPHSRSASLALVAPFEGTASWLTAGGGRGLDLELGGGSIISAGGGDRRTVDGSVIGPRHANPLYGVKRNSGEKASAGAAATASPSAAGDMEDEEEGRTGVSGSSGSKRGFHVLGGSTWASEGSNGSGITRKGQDDHDHDVDAKAGATSRGNNNSNSGDGTDSGSSRDTNDTLATEEVGVGGGGESSSHSNERNIDDDAPPESEELKRGTSVPLLGGTHGNSEEGNGGGMKSASARRPRREGDQSRGSRRGRSSSSSLAAFSVRTSAEGVVAGAQSLSPLEAFVPGAKETLGVVAGLARLAAADHRGDAKYMRRRVRWCKGVVMTLERARTVLGKAAGADHDVEAKRVAVDAVKEPIGCMVEIVQCYKNKHVVSEVFSSSLFRRRQTEADEAVVAAERLLAALEEGSDPYKVSEAVRAKAHRTQQRRESLLRDQVDIPSSDVNVIESEVLGVGGFGTVYLADLGGGLNAAAKVVAFRQTHSRYDDEDDGGNSSSGTNSGTNDNNFEEDARGAPDLPVQTHKVFMESPVAGGGRQDDFAPTADLVDQKLRRRAVVARARRQAAEARAVSRQRLACIKELEAMKRLRGPHTVHTYGAVISSDRLVLVMEFMPGGDLLLRLRKAKRPLENRVLRQIVRDICSGLAFLHAEDFVHGDLKSANILFDAKGTAKIADLGTSLWTQCTSRAATYSTRPGGLMSLPWAAPEVLRREGATAKSDVYSFGVVIWECLSRKVPWEDVTSIKILSSSVQRGQRPTVPENAPADLAAMARLCWASDPDDRPSLHSVLSDILDSMEGGSGGGGRRGDVAR